MEQSKRNIVDAEYDAIELGLFALAYMLRKTRDLALDLAHHERTSKPGVAKDITQESLNEAIGVLRDSRRKVAQLFEMVGSFRKSTDAITLQESEVFRPAYEAMRKLKLKDEE